MCVSGEGGTKDYQRWVNTVFIVQVCMGEQMLCLVGVTFGFEV